ncbi:ribonuclease PH [Peptoniphilus indolicus]|uniref:Multifunctional fusion protein n=1 Tax=Peptoniphilus indolicus TaxID=33030 RepID=A0A379DEH8_9FIRM|nr:Ribonuclease PH [Peptoniphilus indolicus]
MRKDRNNNEMRNIKIQNNYLNHPDGSVLIECGNTKIICTAMIEDKVPFFLKGKNTGWLSSEYSMLPGSTDTRKVRDSSRGKIDGRSQEIQRLIGRSLRQAIDLSKIGERTIWIDCDVISADGGTRTTSINGAYVALKLAVDKYIEKGIFNEDPIISKIAALSVGVVNGENLVDLCYKEDSKADVDLNLVINDKFEFIEIQGTAEGRPFSLDRLNQLLDLSKESFNKIFEIQEKATKKAKKIVLSTDNAHKVEEINKILEGLDVQILTKSEILKSNLEVEENSDTLQGNAHLKAVEMKKYTNYAVIADDTGLFVDELNGEPGVKSARYNEKFDHNDTENRKLLLKNLEKSSNRKAKFKTVIAYIGENNEEIFFEGVCKGDIIKSEKGDAGFGYDSIFVPKGYDKTFAELGNEEKNKISHRSNALKKFRQFIEDELSK